MPAFSPLLAGLWLAIASGGPDESEEAEAEAAVERTVVDQAQEGDGLDAQRTMDARTPGFGTVVELEHEKGARPNDALPEVLNRIPSTHVRSLGGLGQFAAVSIRASSSQQVRISMDGIPLDSASAGTLNIASIPLEGLRRVEVYRGYIPLEYGGSTIGGVINLVGEGVARERVNRAWLGFGSFATQEFGGSLEMPLGDKDSIRARVGASLSEGRFAFYDNGNTPSMPGDDSFVPRVNNDYARVNASLRWDARRGALRWSLQQISGVKEQGVPGIGSAQARSSRLDSTSTRTLARIEKRGFWAPGGSLAWLGSVGFSERLFSDPLGEVGLGVDEQRTFTRDVYVSPRLRLPMWRGAFMKLSADGRGEWVEIEDSVAASATRSGDSQRRRASLGAGVALEQFVAERRVQLVAALRADAIVNRFALPEGQGEVDEAGEDASSQALTPRFGVRARLVDGLSLRLSAGRYFRAPNLIELFGDQGYVLGREDLVAETGTNFDLGFVFDREVGEPGRRWAVYGQVAGYGSFTENLITWVQAGTVLRPVNLEGARVLGVESGAQVQAPRRLVIVQANYTFADTVNLSRASSQNGEALPGRPRHQVFTRASVGRQFGLKTKWEPRVFYGVEYTASTFLDPSGRLSLPPRNFHHVGAEAHVGEHLDLAFEVRNLLNQRQVSWQPPIAGEAPVPTAIVDFIGYPLPGRSLWGSLRIKW